jgi:hypothetical protein
MRAAKKGSFLMSGSIYRARLDPWESVMQVYRSEQAESLRSNQTTATQLARKENIGHAAAARILEKLVKSGKATSEMRRLVLDGMTRQMRVYTLTGVRSGKARNVDRPARRHSD